MNLSEYGELLAYEIAFWTQGLENPNYPFEERGQLSLDIARNFRTLAIINLVAQADPDHFFHNLIRSGRVRIMYLARVLDVRIMNDYHYASSRCDSFLDTIAANELKVARRIALLSPTDWQQGREYEDDYCYAQILQEFILTEPRDSRILALLAELSAYLGGKSSAKLELCYSLLGRSQADFEKSFAALLQEREAKILADENRGQLEELATVAEHRVFVEGLAILRIAEIRGLVTEQEYQYCPSLARVQMKAPFPGE